MSEFGDAAQAVAALAFGGFFFIVVGGALSSSMATEPAIDLQFWGVIYILVAILLAVTAVWAFVASILN